MRAMTAAEMVKVYVANNEARRNQTMIDSVYAPELKAAIANYAKTAMPAFKVSEQWKTQLAEIAANQPKMQFPKIEIPQSLLEQMGKQIQLQNQDLIKIAKKHAALFGGVKFQLPENYLEAAAVWRGQLADEAAADDPNVAGERLRKLAREREAIIKCLYRIGLGLEGFAYVPKSGVPHFIGFLFLLAAMFGEVADEFLSEDDDLD